MSPIPSVALFVALLGHFGLWLFALNRINATGLPRHVVKWIEKGVMVLAMTIPFAVLAIDWQASWDWLLHTTQWLPKGGTCLPYWLAVSWATVLVLGPGWLYSRLGLIPPRHLLSQKAQQYKVSQELGQSPVVNPLFKAFALIPGNQMTDVEIVEKEIQIDRSVPGIDGLRIAHLSDLHLAQGKIDRRFHEFAVDRMLEHRPDLIAVTGDIIDYDRCLPWLEPLLGRVQAPLGCTYVLGNHDRRVRDQSRLMSLLSSTGYRDLGAASHSIALSNGTLIQLLGNELPWYNRMPSETPMPEISDRLLTIGLSHSPDQIGWARRRNIDLLLAGHTHGGQIRIPGIGPLVAPSRYGSRFASGTFWLPPTVMHVVRGLSGVHPIRLWCMPEIAILTLRSGPPLRSGPAER